MFKNTKTRQNRLATEISPYLLQHKDNPVDWWPWCDEAFARAREEDKPVFLSIGYSTCHWCHVMARESFEDDEVAELLNRSFISIKVDREERPDIDAVYMSVCQALTGSGGWPLTVFLTPEREAFFAGTYFPKRQSYGRTGLIGLLKTIAAQWRADKRDIICRAAEVTSAMSEFESRADGKNEPPSEKHILEAAMALARDYDSRNGGFGTAPKFPTPHNLMFLLRYHACTGDSASLQMVTHTLSSMYKGGIFDHIGYGFSRYSTDERWLVPHFEKMLYDNALLTIAYIEAWQVTKRDLFLDVAEKVLDYVSREMTSPEGGFYSAQDADSDGIEGRFYTFTPFEIESVLDKNTSAEFVNGFSITATGNFDGRSVPNLLEHGEGAVLSNAAIATLRGYRKKRTQLHTDDKILTSWNAMMIIAYTKAYRATGAARYLTAAKDAYTFISDNLIKDGELFISWRNGEARGRAVLDDFAYLTWASIELYDSTFDVCYLERAVQLARQAVSLFSDPQGGYFLTASGGEDFLYRPKETYDGATPSGNSVFALCLSKLEALTGEREWSELLHRQLEFCVSSMSGFPRAGVFSLLPLMSKVYGSQELICVLGDEQKIEDIVLKLGERFVPGLCTLVLTPQNRQMLSEIAPHTAVHDFDGADKFYMCSGEACQAPVMSIDELAL